VTLWNLLLVLLMEICSVAGQILFKHAVAQKTRLATIKVIGAGILSKAIEFFLWLGLLAKFQLSYIYPFDGLNRVILVLGASFFLKEKTSPRLWLGVLSISAGVVLISASPEERSSPSGQHRPDGVQGTEITLESTRGVHHG
jgi:undecaprenyl phosphate-alpha-L-ara4N flippase subunit ArnE